MMGGGGSTRPGLNLMFVKSAIPEFPLGGNSSVIEPGKRILYATAVAGFAGF